MKSNGKVTGYLHAKGRWMVNGNEDPIILRGWAAGNWMNPEGYMIDGISGMYGFTDMGGGLVNNIRFDRQRTIAYGVRELAGTQYASTFWQRWYRAYLSEGDIRAMAELGYNSVRLVLDGNGFLYEEPGIQFNEDTFAMLDQVLDWCEQYGLYAILDLHAAPGGQSGVSCDNGIDNQPHMFTEPESYERTLVLWEEFARRYKDRWIVGAYELLNEPVSPPSLRGMSAQLRQFYEEAIARVRKIDQKHMFILEPPAFAHDMAFLDKGFDPEHNNWAYSVHLYWFNPQMSDFYQYLEPSRRLNVPVWIGEGRGNPADMAVFYDMVAEYGVGFNAFCWKYMRDEEGNANNGLFSYPMPQGWEKIARYIDQGGPRPSYEESQKLLDAWIEASHFENCQTVPLMAEYTLRRQGITLPAAGYDSEEGSFHGTWREGNVYAYRAEDKIKMVRKEGAPIPHIFDKPIVGLEHLLVDLREGEFVTYSVNLVESPAPAKLTGQALEDTTCQVTVGTTTQAFQWKKGQLLQGESWLPLVPGARCGVRIQVERGELLLQSVEFPLV